MIIDNTPTIDEANNTFAVAKNIDASEDVIIYVNGLMGIFNDDMTDITDNVITISPDLDINYSEDVFIVVYDELV